MKGGGRTILTFPFGGLYTQVKLHYAVICYQTLMCADKENITMLDMTKLLFKCLSEVFCIAET